MLKKLLTGAVIASLFAITPAFAKHTAPAAAAMEKPAHPQIKHKKAIKKHKTAKPHQKHKTTSTHKKKDELNAS